MRETLRRAAVLSSEQQDTWGRIRARSISYSADGHYLAVAANDQPVVIWDLKSKSVEDRLPVLFSGDGRSLAVMRSSQTFSGSNEILVIHRETGKTVSLRCNCFSIAFSPDSDKLISVGTKFRFLDPGRDQEIRY